MRAWAVVFFPLIIVLLWCNASVADASKADSAESQAAHEARVFANSLKYFDGIRKTDDGYLVGVVYSPEVGSSRKAADVYAAAMNSSEDASRLGIKAKVISSSEIKGSGVGIIYVAPDIAMSYPQIYSAAKADKIFVYGHDAECVWQKLCAMAIKIDYTLEISLSDAAIKDSGFGVDPMLRLLVKRLER